MFSRSTIFLLTLLLHIPLALAEPPSGRRTETSADTRAAAKAHYEAGDRAFRLGDFEKSIREFKESYDLSGVPLLLYNIAQAYRQMGDAKNALFFYRQFVGTGQADSEAKRIAEQRIEELRAVLEQQRKAQEAPPIGTAPAGAQQTSATATAPPPAARATVPPPTARQRDGEEYRGESRKLVIAGWSVGGFGVASLVVAGVCVGLAKSANDEITNTGTFNLSAQDRRNTLQALDAAFFAIGGAAIAAGATVLVVGKYQHGHHERAALSITPTASATQAGVVLTGGF